MPFPPRPFPIARAPRPPAGFSFIELLMVMAMMGLLAALAAGYLTGVGTSSRIDQARAALIEVAQACKAASNGGRRATMSLVERTDEYRNTWCVVSAEVAGPVLTCQFETLEFASQGRRPQVRGAAKVVPEGRTGNALELTGGSLVFGPGPEFAMTEGLEVDVWVNVDPRATGRRMVILASDPEAYEIGLERVGDGARFDVVLQLKVRPATETGRAAAGEPRRHASVGAPVRADGHWQHVQVAWNGLTASLRVDGLETVPPAAGPGSGPEALQQLVRLAPIAGGLAHLQVGASRAPFHGRLDSLRVRGVFRAAEQERELPAQLKVLSPPLPHRIVFYNGRLDPELHPEDVLVRVTDEGAQGDPDLYLQIGRFGSIEPYEPRRAPGPEAPLSPGAGR